MRTAPACWLLLDKLALTFQKLLTLPENESVPLLSVSVIVCDELEGWEFQISELAEADWSNA